jgi:predicted cobalt transporter CbtA
MLFAKARPMTDRQQRQIVRIAGETIREVGVLLLVFAPLDAIFAPDALTARYIVAIVVFAVVVIVIGIAAEVK